MYHYGGGYSDIKCTTGSWAAAFDELEQSDKWICGYPSIGKGGIAYGPVAEYWTELIGPNAYIAKPHTPLLKEILDEIIAILDLRFEQLKLHPGLHPYATLKMGYPIDWSEICGRIFHKLSYKYKETLLRTLPISIFKDYR
jgi:hypothetical protein